MPKLALPQLERHLLGAVTVMLAASRAAGRGKGARACQVGGAAHFGSGPEGYPPMKPRTGPGPEEEARKAIDAALEEADWEIQDRDEMDLSAAQVVAVRDFPLATGLGFADYLLFVDGRVVAVLEAKPAGYPLTGNEPQADKHATGLPSGLAPPVDPLLFLYLSTGVETRFINLLDPEPKTRRIFQVHRPGTLAEWLSANDPRQLELRRISG